jgi:hypothetical protein
MIGKRLPSMFAGHGVQGPYAGYAARRERDVVDHTGF